MAILSVVISQLQMPSRQLTNTIRNKLNKHWDYEFKNYVYRNKASVF